MYASCNERKGTNSKKVFWGMDSEWYGKRMGIKAKNVCIFGRNKIRVLMMEVILDMSVEARIKKNAKM